MTQYTIRYRYGNWRGRIALIVDDGRGNAYLVSGGRLQARLTGSGACVQLARMLSRIGVCARPRNHPVYPRQPAAAHRAGGAAIPCGVPDNRCMKGSAQ
jgi:hypothetical protein